MDGGESHSLRYSSDVTVSFSRITPRFLGPKMVKFWIFRKSMQIRFRMSPSPLLMGLKALCHVFTLRTHTLLSPVGVSLSRHLTELGANISEVSIASLFPNKASYVISSREWEGQGPTSRMLPLLPLQQCNSPTQLTPGNLRNRGSCLTALRRHPVTVRSRVIAAKLECHR